METQNNKKDTKNVNIEEVSREVLIEDCSKEVNVFEEDFTREVQSDIYSFDEIASSLENV